MATFAFVLIPVLAEARPGGRNSSGSRGSQTYSAPPPTQTAPGPAALRPAGDPTRAPGRQATTAARPGMAALPRRRTAASSDPSAARC